MSRPGFVVHVFNRDGPPPPRWQVVWLRVLRWLDAAFVAWPTVLWWRVRYGLPHALAHWRRARAVAKARRLLGNR